MKWVCTELMDGIFGNGFYPDTQIGTLLNHGKINTKFQYITIKIYH